eukprot:SRR837773.9877.p1 GENE.SRR837773.9877~~SRR837773.9877.p1  ORF type:complete len:199 (+),score=40.71 SRR837773.9877:32-598(+)
MIVYSSPAFIVLWAAVLLGEPIRVPVLLCILACFGGLLLIVRPWKEQRDSPLWAYGLSGVAAVFAGLVYVSLKELKHVRYHFVLNAFQFVGLTLSIVVGSALGRLPVPRWGSPAWGYLLGVALAAYAAEVCITLGFARATPQTLGQVSVLKFLSPIFSILWGLLFLSSAPGRPKWPACCWFWQPQRAS